MAESNNKHFIEIKLLNQQLTDIQQTNSALRRQIDSFEEHRTD